MSESFDKQLEIARAYAQALFALASERGKAEQVREEMEEVIGLVEAEPELAAFFASRALDAEVRERALERWFRGRISDELLNTVLVMNRNGRSGLIKALHRGLVLEQEAAANQAEGVAISAVPLDAKQQKQVVDMARKLTGKNPLIDFRVDPEVLGGLSLQVGDLRFDNTVRRHLGEARARLAERAERGLRAGAAT